VGTARRNATRLGVAGRSAWAVSSWFDALKAASSQTDPALRGPFDVIVSNPPYIGAADWPALAPTVEKCGRAPRIVGHTL